MSEHQESNVQRRIFYAIVWGLLLFSLIVRVALTLNRNFDWDEFQHLHAAWMVSEQYLPYKDFWENHTPLLYYLLAPVVRFFGEGTAVLLIARALMSAAALGILYVTYALARLNYDRKTSILAVVVLSYMAIFVQKSIEIRPDQLLALFWLASLWLAMLAVERQKSHGLFYAGLLLGIAFLFSPKALFPYGAMSLTFFVPTYFHKAPRQWLYFIKLQSLYTLGFLIPVGMCLAFFYQQHAVREFITATVLENLNYPDIYKPTYLLNLRHMSFFLLSAMGLVIAGRTLRKSTPTALQRQLMLLSPGLSLMLMFLFFMPAPYSQSTLLFAPILAIYAAAALRKSIDRVMTQSLSPTSRKARRSRAINLLALACTMAAALLIPCWALFKAQPFTKTNHDQLERMNSVLKLTQPTEAVFDGSCCYIFRPQAYYYGSLVTGIVWRIRQGEIRQDIPESLLRNNCRVIIYDERVATLPESVQAFLKTYYRPSGIAEVYIANGQP